MRISELLIAMANELESPENEAVLLAEYDDECLKVVAENCILAAAILKKAAEEVDEIEPKDPHLNVPNYSWEVYKKVYESDGDYELVSNDLVNSFVANYEDALVRVKELAKQVLGPDARLSGGAFGRDGGFWRFIDQKNNPDVHFSVIADPVSTVTPESLDGLANLATALDSSNDPELKKQASVIDELLLTIAAPPGVMSEKRAANEKRLDELRKKYEDPRQELEDTNKIADSLKAIDKSEMVKEYKILEAPLSTRYCPDHAGAQISRIGEHLWQCELDKKTYDFENGFTLNNGTKVPGGDVSQQTQGLNVPYHSIFDDRQGRLGYNKP